MVGITRQRRRGEDKGRREGYRREGEKQIKQQRKTDKSLNSYPGRKVDCKWRKWRWNCNWGWYKIQLSLLVHFIIWAQVLLCSNYVIAGKRHHSVGFDCFLFCVCVCLFSPDTLMRIKKRRTRSDQSDFLDTTGTSFSWYNIVPRLITSVGLLLTVSAGGYCPLVCRSNDLFG